LIGGLEVVAVADREASYRSFERGDSMVGAAGQDRHRQNEAEDEDP